VKRLVTITCGWVAASGWPAVAAVVTGEVYDVRSGDVVPGASVIVAGEKAVTDKEGIYRLVAVDARPTELVARAEGYAVTVVAPLEPGGADAELWVSVPLLPRRAETRAGGDFGAFFFARAPLTRDDGGRLTAKRRAAPGRVAVAGTDDVAAVADAVAALNSAWRAELLTPAPAGAPAGGETVRLTFNANAYAFDIKGDGGASASFVGAPDARNVALTTAFLRRVVLAEGGGGAVTAAELNRDLPVAADLDAVIRIIYGEPPDFNYGVFRRRAPGRIFPLGDVALGIGSYGRSGVAAGDAGAASYPVRYDLGQVALTAGVAYLPFWVKGGWSFAGIWGGDAERLADPEAPAEKVILRNRTVQLEGGVDLRVLPYIRVRPTAGYRWLTVHGEYKSGPAPVVPARSADFDVTSRHDGPDAGMGVTGTLPWFNVNLYGEYARVFASRPYNWLDVGAGPVNRIGVGTLASVRWYWGEDFKYTFGALVLKFDLPW